MSHLNYLEKLLDGVEVECKPLESIAHFQNAKPHEKFVSKDGDIALLTSKFVSTEGRQARWIHKSDVLTPAFKNDVALVMSDLPNGRALARTFLVLEDDRYAANQRVCLLRVKDATTYSPKFLNYVMNRNAQLLAYDNGYDQTHLKKDWILKVEIPIPCPDNPEKSLAIQAEIVRILDAFTAMTAELTAELNMRKKQYNYYRDQLLSFEEGDVEWKALGEVFNIFAGGDKPKDAFSEEETDEFNVPILSNGIGLKSLYGWTNLPKITEPSLTVSARGTIGWTSYRDRPFFPIIRLLVLTPKIGVNTKYAYYYMKTIENNYPVPPAGIPQLTKPMIENVQFPIPYPNDPERSQAEQARIVAILDKFDALTNSITEGLPREIELRQKQYEYYRDLLLSFPKSHSDEAA